MQQVPAGGSQAAQAAQAADMMNQTMADGFEALRADRLLERVTPKTFSKIFPTNAVGICCLCLVGDEFWQFGQAFVTKRGINNTLAEVKPVVSTAPRSYNTINLPIPNMSK